MRYSLHISMVVVTIYMVYVILLWILHYALPEYFLYWKVCYIYYLNSSDYATAPVLYLCLYWYVCSYYNGVLIDTFVYVILYNHRFYFILGVWFYIAPVHGLFHHYIIVTYVLVFICLWMLYPCFLWFFCVLHKIYSLVVLHIGNVVMHIFCIFFVVAFLP